ncbi:MAG: alpha-methylacyl-CoA racemase, partial [Pseudonocardiales bacterium]|nr:alpha-methylacyl-CoA racemase [Pseudonocardiales bacterium]
EQWDRAAWPALRDRFATAFAGRSRAEWTQVFAGRDAYVTPVLRMSEAVSHPHNVERATFVQVGGIAQPAPAPRFGRTPAGPPRPGVPPGADTDAVLAEMGASAERIADLRAAGAVR